jgi:uncharacterized protein
MRIIKVQGRGVVSAEPDICILSFVAEAQTKEYSDCLSTLNQHTEQLRQGLSASGLNIHDLKTTDFNIRIEYKYVQQRHVFVGYRGSHHLHIELPTNKDLLNKILGKVAEGYSGVEISISFSVKDKESLRNRTLQEAVRVARANAKTIADAAGLKLGEIQQLDYGWAEVRIHEYGSRMVMEDSLMAISPPDIDPEDVSAEDSVTLVYEIED